MPTYAVEYRYADRPADLAQLRPSHRSFLAALLDEGVLVASGPLEPGGALLLVRAGSSGEVLGVLDADPFRTAGLVAERTVREWDPVLRSWD